MEIRILGHDRQALCRGILPEIRVGSGIQAQFVDVHGTGVEVRQKPNEVGREVVIEQEPYRFGTAISFRWMSAANASEARMSSASR